MSGPEIPLPPVVPPTNDERKALPLWDFLMGYFPRTFVELTKVSVAGNAQHLNGDAKIRWAREKSTDQLNTAMRHQFDYGTGTMFDTDGRHHLVKAIWRLCARTELDLEALARSSEMKSIADAGPGPIISVPRCTAIMLTPAGERCGLSDGHPGPHAPKPRICTDCGADLAESFHAAGCLRSAQPYR